MSQLVCACPTETHEPDCPNLRNDWHCIGATMYRGRVRDHVPCPARETVYLSASDYPNGVVLRCGLLDDHYGPHVVHMGWSDAVPEEE